MADVGRNTDRALDCELTVVYRTQLQVHSWSNQKSQIDSLTLCLGGVI